MVGKIRHIRQKIHQEAVKLERPGGVPPSPLWLLQTETPRSAEPQSCENQKTEAAKNAKKVSASWVCVYDYCPFYAMKVHHCKPKTVHFTNLSGF